jgi:hypothetical protein
MAVLNETGAGANSTQAQDRQILRNTGPMLASLHCGAKTRSGKACRSPAVQGKKALSDAWRCGGIRRTERQSERGHARPLSESRD